MMDYVHIDEKWFYITNVKENYYILPDELPPERKSKSKRFITKVMFMAADARPRYDFNKKRIFDGKIGIWPFVVKEPAKRFSKNRSRGTLVTKAITSVNKESIRQMMLENVIPAIKEKWPLATRMQPIIIQQDNAKPHCSVDDSSLVEAATEGTWKISFRCQPPNSPDLNVLDLGYFNSIQSLQHKKAPKSIDELIEAVHESFNALTADSLNDVFLSLQMCMEEIMRCDGGNNYKLRHMSKAKLRREGRLPMTLMCDPSVLDKVRSIHATDIAIESVAVAASPHPGEFLPNGCKLFSDCCSRENVACIYCGENTSAVHFCSLCLYVVHAFCGDSEGNEGYGQPVKCFRCRPK
jgi:hypothetical protein